MWDQCDASPQPDRRPPQTLKFLCLTPDAAGRRDVTGRRTRLARPSLALVCLAPVPGPAPHSSPGRLPACAWISQAVGFVRCVRTIFAPSPKISQNGSPSACGAQLAELRRGPPCQPPAPPQFPASKAAANSSKPTRPGSPGGLAGQNVSHRRSAQRRNQTRACHHGDRGAPTPSPAPCSPLDSAPAPAVPALRTRTRRTENPRGEWPRKRSVHRPAPTLPVMVQLRLAPGHLGRLDKASTRRAPAGLCCASPSRPARQEGGNRMPGQSGAEEEGKGKGKGTSARR